MDDLARLLDHPVILRRAFHPRHSAVKGNFVASAGDRVVECHVRRTQPEAGWVLYFHGNGELAAECDEYNAWLFTEAGFNVGFVEYRGYGSSQEELGLASMLGDGASVVAALGVPASRVVAFGRSLGSVYAIELAHRLPELGGLILESGIADLNEQWSLEDKALEMGCEPGEILAAVSAKFDHRAKLGSYKGPTLVLHATRDHLVPVTHGQRLHDWAGGAEKRLVLFPIGNHNSIMVANSKQYVAEVQNFLKRTRLGGI